MGHARMSDRGPPPILSFRFGGTGARGLVRAAGDEQRAGGPLLALVITMLGVVVVALVTLTTMVAARDDSTAAVMVATAPPAAVRPPSLPPPSLPGAGAACTWYPQQWLPRVHVQRELPEPCGLSRQACCDLTLAEGAQAFERSDAGCCTLLLVTDAAPPLGTRLVGQTDLWGRWTVESGTGTVTG